MVDNSFLQGAGAAQPVSGRVPTGPKTTSKPAGAAFQALLEKLETQARELARTSETVGSPTELAGAVDSARESLDDALSLGDRLFEAYRAAQQNAASPDSGNPNEKGS